MEKDIGDKIIFQGLKPSKVIDFRMLSPQVLAFLGDSVYESAIRSYLIAHGDYGVDKLHRMSTNFVKAKSQALIVHRLEDFFSEEEWRIIKRGRNSKSNSIPKNADMVDYKYATGFESLIGYLYLKGDISRLDAVLSRVIDIVGGI